MTLGLFNLAILLGLFALIIPLVIHFLSRRRYEVIDWGAMQFLEIGEAKRRRFLIEELLLMALRMGLIALMVFALAAPYVSGPLVAELSPRPNRDVVLIFDGSASMNTREGQNSTLREAAKNWAQDFFEELVAGDRVAVVLAGRQPEVLLESPSQDWERVKEVIDQLPNPEGVCRWPRAVSKALEILERDSQWAHKEILLLGDGQSLGLADASSLLHWKEMAYQLRSKKEADPTDSLPRMWFVDLRGDQPVANFTLKPIRSLNQQTYVNQPVRFQTALSRVGTDWPGEIPLWLYVDGEKKRKLTFPIPPSASSDEASLSFSHTFTQTGTHHVSVLLEAEEESSDPIDDLRADNRQDFIISVRKHLPVLLVDGDITLSASSTTAHLQEALRSASSPGKDSGGLVVQRVAWPDFQPALLRQPILPGVAGSQPRVLVLSDVPQFSNEQVESFETFLENGGGILMVTGPYTTDPDQLDRFFYRGNKGWLPARLTVPAERNPPKEEAASIGVLDLKHPLLKFFGENPNCHLGQSRFLRWWKVETPEESSATIMARLTTGDPMLIEKPYKKGKAILCTVPVDGSWDSNLPRVWEYPLLMQLLVYYLANSESLQHNLQPGQPLLFQPEDNKPGQESFSIEISLRGPNKLNEVVSLREWPFVYEQTFTPGLYELTMNDRTISYLVHPSQEEWDHTSISPQQQKMLEKEFTIRDHELWKFENQTGTIGRAVLDPNQKQDLWWLLLIGVVLFLCLEIAMTRRMVKART